MSGSRFHLGVTCPACGRAVTTLAAGQPTDGGRRTTTVVKCGPCRREWQVIVELVDPRRRPPELLPH